MTFRLSAVLTAVFLSVSPLAAGQPVKVDLGPIDHKPATLVVVDVNGVETSYAPAELEQFTTYSIVTVTPWRSEPAEFSGVLLSDVLAAHGLDTVSAIRVTAENDYRTSLSRQVLDDVDILVATRVNGQPHNRRERGPIQFVIDADSFKRSQHTDESNLVWMAARIEADTD
jgi:hypothetical protein